jgi:hypothetical protein
VRLIGGVLVGTTPALDDTELREQEDIMSALVTTGQFTCSYHVLSSFKTAAAELAHKMMTYRCRVRERALTSSSSEVSLSSSPEVSL